MLIFPKLFAVKCFLEPILDRVVCTLSAEKVIGLAKIPKSPGVKSIRLTSVSPIKIDCEIRIGEFDPISVSIDPDSVPFLSFA